VNGNEVGNTPTVQLSLPLEAAEALHAVLENLLEDDERNNSAEANLERVYRVLAWRILALKSGTGLTGRMAQIAREARTVEEYEAARDRALGPILDGLENAENRDP
jgi:hypothetical protein